MAEMEEFRDALLKYLYREHSITIEEAENQQHMSPEEKIENGLMLTDATITAHKEGVYVLDAPGNYSKFRAGDRVHVTGTGDAGSHNAMIVDVYCDNITIECPKELSESDRYTIEMERPNLLLLLISCLEGIYAGVPGASFLRLLASEIPLETEEFLRLDLPQIPNFESIEQKLDSDQKAAVQKMLEFPPIHVLQGPPGTGKTLVLAATAVAAARMNREVVVIANTHHAVNNALQKIKQLDPGALIVKIGETLKAEELDDSILKFEKFADYSEFSYQNRKKKKSGHIIGMTIWGAIVHLGLHRHSHFRPYMALVDEASLMPLSLGSILGKTAPSVCLFGDSRQMPPIFKSELEDLAQSVSILDYCANSVPGVPVSVLRTTYRMNEEITRVVSRNFYEPYGTRLVSSGYSKDRMLCLPCFESLRMGKGSFCILETDGTDACDDYNPQEACVVADLVHHMLDEGVNPVDIAVITPFRKQVRALRDAVREACGEHPELLIDTVERLQGQDVDCIILSFAASEPLLIQDRKDFLFNPNRINVMISRAKSKVIIVGSSEIVRHMAALSQTDRYDGQ